MHVKKGSFISPSIYMKNNGKNIIGLILEIEGDRVRVFLNNKKDCWLDKQVLFDLFNVSD